MKQSQPNPSLKFAPTGCWDAPSARPLAPRWADMKPLLMFLSFTIAAPALSAGPSLGAIENVVVTQAGIDEKDSFSKYCKDFTLSATKALSFMNKAIIVTQREVHDYYDLLPCFVRGTAIIHGYPAEWEIRAGGTGSITLMSGEYLPIVDEDERYVSDQPTQ